MAKFISNATWVLLVAGCSAATPPSEEPAPSPQIASSPQAEQQEEGALADEREVTQESKGEAAEIRLLAAMPPETCEEGRTCTPPTAFAKEVCKGRYPGLAVRMFEKNTPWKRMYVQVESMEAVNTYGGVTTQNLVFTEEVLVLHYQSSDGGGIKIGGASDVDVLRWDGTCATVREELLSEHRMPTIKNATVTWRYLDPETQEGLLQAKYVKVRYDQQRTVCRKSSASNPTEPCRKATEKLNDAITVAVRGGIQLPDPGELPAWEQPE